jgi:hypothetical protein
VRQLYLGQVPVYTDDVVVGQVWKAADQRAFVEAWKALLDKDVARGVITNEAMNWWLRATGGRFTATRAYL